MSANWKTALLGGVTGACAAVIIVFAAASLGFFPRPSDKQFHDYLMAHPDILVAMQEKMQSDEILAAQAHERDEQVAVNKIGLQRFFDPKVAFVTGPAEAKRTVVEFFDYNCPHCRESYPALSKFYAAHKTDTRFAFIELPIFGGNSISAARAAIAARRQSDKYVDFYFALMGEQAVIDIPLLFDDAKKSGLDMAALDKDIKDPAIDTTLAAARKLADRALVTGTPTFIINGKVHDGAVDDDLLAEMTKS
jgi:protein-disulfide isomerase